MTQKRGIVCRSFRQNNDGMDKIYESSHGNSLSIEFEYPEENPQNYADDITTALNYAGVFKGITQKDADLQ